MLHKGQGGNNGWTAFFSVGEAAKAANTTAETLRHYDRIGLVKPSKKDEWTHYRYYTEQDIVRLNTVRALQLMDLPLQEIKKVLEYDDLEKIIAFFQQAEKRADEKIAALQFSKAKIQLAKADYARNLEQQRQSRSAFLKEYPQRVILLSDTLEMPTLENLWNYLNHFYEKLPTGLKGQFAFEDLAGIYTEGVKGQAVCGLYPLRGAGGTQDAAGGALPVRPLHRGDQNKSLGRAAAPGPGGVWGKSHPLPCSSLSCREFYSGIMRCRSMWGNRMQQRERLDERFLFLRRLR